MSSGCLAKVVGPATSAELEAAPPERLLSAQGSSVHS